MLTSTGTKIKMGRTISAVRMAGTLQAQVSRSRSLSTSEQIAQGGNDGEASQRVKAGDSELHAGDPLIREAEHLEAGEVAVERIVDRRGYGVAEPVVVVADDDRYRDQRYDEKEERHRALVAFERDAAEPDDRHEPEQRAKQAFLIRRGPREVCPAAERDERRPVSESAQHVGEGGRRVVHRGRLAEHAVEPDSAEIVDERDEPVKVYG